MVTDVPMESPNFSIFIHSMAQQALMGLGLAPWPDSGSVEARLDVAREMIEILAMLQEKTKGNLTPDEERLVTTLIYELRMVYVEKMAQKSS
jgi:hypothetical protein